MSDSFAIKKSHVFLIVGIAIAVIVGMTIYNNVVQPTITWGGKTIDNASAESEATKVANELVGTYPAGTNFTLVTSNIDEYLVDRDDNIREGTAPWVAPDTKDSYVHVFFYRINKPDGSLYKTFAVWQETPESQWGSDF
jgi:hypothetical protein